MKNNKIFALVAVIIVAVASIGVVYLLTANNDSEDGTMTDMRGRKVAVPEEIDSILCINSCSLELVSFFDAVNKVTHIDANEKFEGKDNRTHSFIMKDKLSSLPKVSADNEEAILSTGVDIVISSTIESEKLDALQQKIKIPVFAINADLEFGEEFDKQILLLGKLFNEEERAEEIVNGVKGFISAITNKAPKNTTVSGYVCGMNFYMKSDDNFFRSTGDYLPFKYINVKNIVPTNPNGTKQPYPIDRELPLNENPDYIFFDGAFYDDVLNYLKDNINLYENVPAVEENNIYKTMVYKSWGTNWVNQLINAYYVADVICGDVYDWNFTEEADKIIQLFYPDTTIDYATLSEAQSGGPCRQIFI